MPDATVIDLNRHRALRAECRVPKRRVAEFFGVSERTIERWQKQGMPAHRWGRRCVRYVLSECAQWRATHLH